MCKMLYEAFRQGRSQMILEYDFCMFLLNIEVFNIMTPDFPYTSENETKCTTHPTTGYLDNRCYRELRSYLRHTE